MEKASILSAPISRVGRLFGSIRLRIDQSIVGLSVRTVLTDDASPRDVPEGASTSRALIPYVLSSTWPRVLIDHAFRREKFQSQEDPL